MDKQANNSVMVPVLKLRVLTALILLPLALAAIFMLPADWFLALLALVFLIGTSEYSRLAGLSGRMSAQLLIVVQAIIFISLYLLKDHWGNDMALWLTVGCIAWLLMFIRLPMYRPPSSPADSSYRLVSSVTAIVSITSAWFALSWLSSKPDGPWLILLLLLIVWAADTGAYFSGKAFGKRKLAPQISPGKTIEGLLGGLLLAPVVTLIAVYLMPITDINSIWIALLSLVVALISVGGDLMISMHKRISGFKDSGNLLPGHGGILDRVDSLLAAAPFFALGLLAMGL